MTEQLVRSVLSDPSDLWGQLGLSNPSDLSDQLGLSDPSDLWDPLHLSNQLDLSDPLHLSDPLGLRRVPWDRSGRPAPSAPSFPSVLSVRMAADSPGSSMTAPGSQIYALPVLFFL